MLSPFFYFVCRSSQGRFFCKERYNFICYLIDFAVKNIYIISCLYSLFIFLQKVYHFMDIPHVFSSLFKDKVVDRF